MRRARVRIVIAAAVCLASQFVGSAAVANDNGRGRHKQLYAVPAPGQVTIDGSLADWDLSGQIEMFVVQATRGTMNAKFAVMYDAEALYLGAARGGAQALGRDAGEIAVGRLADLVALDATHPALCALPEARLLDGLAFAAPDGVVTDLWSAGRHMVRGGRHLAREAIIAAYRRAVAALMQGL